MRATSSPGTDADGSGPHGPLPGFGRFAVRLSWPFRPWLLDAAWAVFSAINLVAILAFPGWETIPFHVIWISVTLVYGFRTWAPAPTLWVLGVVMATTRQTASLLDSDWTPQTLGSSRMTPCHCGSRHMDSATSVMISRISDMSWL